MTKLLVTGSRGLLGSDLVRVLGHHYDVIGIGRSDFDITNHNATIDAVKHIHPDVILHTAAFTDVDGCEEQPDLAVQVNTEGTRNVALAGREVGARVVYYSTDYVFDGNKTTAYVETDTPNPQTVYGHSKLEGEKSVASVLDEHLILRVGWLYGAQGRNFIRTILKKGQHQIKNGDSKPLDIVNDQIGNPTWTVAVAKQTRIMIDNQLNGLFHATSSGETSWYDLARVLFEQLQINVKIRPCLSDNLSRMAARPAYSSLENKRLADMELDIMQDWRVELEEFLASEGFASDSLTSDSLAGEGNWLSDEV